MKGFTVKIITPAGIVYESNAEKIILRTVSGDICILENHINYLSFINKSPVKIDNLETGICYNGFVKVYNDEVAIVSESFESYNG